MSRIFSIRLMTGTALLSTCLLGGPPLSAAHAAETTPDINVISTTLAATPGYHFFLSQDLRYSGATDGGDFLSTVPGVSLSRMGGHGTEPIIRGQQQTQLNIVNDGAMAHGGCPNRMDPPTSFLSPQNYDSVTVLKGYQSVRYGAGGTGGTVLFDRNPLPFAGDSLETEGRISGQYESNGQIRGISGDVAAGSALAQIRALWSTLHGNSYKDGNDTEVRSAFSSESYSILPSWTPNEDTTVEASFEASRTDDTLFAGASMDSPEGSDLTQSLGFSHLFHGETLKKLAAKFYLSHVDHLMDNFSLRENSGMKMKTPSKSDSFGGQVYGDFVLNTLPLSLGVDLQNNDRDAWRYSGMAMATDATTPQSRLWPDVRIRQTGFFAEADPQLSETTRLRLGGRYDYVEAEAQAAARSFGSTSPNALYLAHYGVIAEDKTEHNLSGLLRLEHDMAAGPTLFAGLSRSVRTADATERYMAGNSATPALRWIGNPDLSPEKHHQLDIGASQSGANWNMTVAGYYDYVSDFIMRDVARGQDGVLVSNGATIYRNIDASLMGLELEGKYTLYERWNLLGNLTYTYGNNREDDDALAQIPPLEGRLAVEYAADFWNVGTGFNFATKQTRLDDQTSQRDLDTAGYGTLDIYGTMQVAPFEMRIGINNVFDKTYARHLNRSNAFDPSEIQVNEPGRSFGVQLHAKF